MNRDRYNDYEWYGNLMNHRQVSSSCRTMNNVGIHRRRKAYRPCCVDLAVTIIAAVVFTVGMYVWLA